ncbi:MAG: glycosyltransferase family 2 protein, partial [Candidatus Omnitrophica bacterium]|nr:glycosyltransferase family 2 protein [Candidatus Omnitrophota bacterium]
MVDVSVILCTYNRVGYLKEAIESVVAQTFTDWELILVNDGSTDETEEMVRPYLKSERRIRYFKKNNESCSASARNYGLSHVRGKYVAFLDDDDRWLPKKLELQVNLMESRPEIGWCYTRFQIYLEEEGKLKPTKSFPEFLPTTFEELFRAFVPPSTVLMRKSCLDQAGWFNPKFRHSEDFDMWLRFGQRWPVAPIDEVLVFTVMDEREHGGKDPLLVHKATSEILKNLKLLPAYRHRKRLVISEIARRIYESGRIYLDEGKYLQAAVYFARALWTDPLVGLAVQRPGEQGFLQLASR